MWGALAGAALGAYKYNQDKNKENRDRYTAAATARYSPWTGMKPGGIDEADAIGTIGTGAFQGASFDQQFGGSAKKPEMADNVENPNIENPEDAQGMTSMNSRPVFQSDAMNPEMDKMRKMYPWMFMNQGPTKLG
jgi:hypothetical protein